MLSPFEHSGTLYVEWQDPDPFFAGIDVLKSGKAPILIFTKGKDALEQPMRVNF